MSYPASVIAESKSHDFLEALAVPVSNLADKEDSKVIEVVRGRSRLMVAISRYMECEGYLVVKWQFKTKWFASSKKLSRVLQAALSKAEAVPIETFEPNRDAHS